MDSNNGIPAKKQAEVILQIPVEEAAVAAAARSPGFDAFKLESIEDPIFKPKSPETFKATPSPRKPPRPPHSDSLVRRLSIPSSAFAKPKSRFAEQPPPTTTNPGDPPLRPPSSPYHGSPGPTPKTPAGDEEDDEEEVYKMEHFPETRKRRRRCRLRTLIEWVILVLAMSCMIASLLVHSLQEHVLWGLEIWRWCLLVSAICCGRLVTHWFITVLVFLIERNFLLKKKVLYFVYGLKNSVQVCIWLGLVLLTWSLLFNHSVPRSHKTLRILSYVSRALASLLLGSVIWMLKIVLVKLLAASFHMTRFFDRIQESIFHQYVLEMLSGPPDMELAEKVGRAKSMGQLSFRSVGKGKGKGKEGEDVGVIDLAKLYRMRQEKVSAWTMKGLITVIRTSGLRTLSNAIDESFADAANEQKDKEITSEWEAKAVAYRIFKNVAKTGYKYIEEEDLLRFLRKEEVDTVLPLFEGASETGKIKKSALRNWVVKAYLERKSLAHSLNDTKTAVKQLHKLASAIVIVIIVVVTLMIMGVATTQVLVILSSQLLLVGFMFQNSCKIVFEAIIFVFVMHPFDVGDRCVVDGVQMTVEEMNILTTVFLRYDNEKIYYPNSVLATKPISNFYRSPDMSDSVEFSVDVKTSMDCIGALKARIKKYLESKPTHWHPNHSIVVKGIVDVNTMNMALNCQHTMNFQNIPEKNSRRTDLVLELKKIFEDLLIQYHLLPQEVHLSYAGSTPLPMAIRLAVVGAFHTSFMEPAVSRLEAALAATEIRAPRIPVVSNVDAQPHTDPETIKKILGAAKILQSCF